MERMPVGIVGGGRVGEGFVKSLGREPDLQVVGIVTSTPARQEELRRRFGIPAYGTVEEMLAADPRPAAICVVNANEDHAPATLAALAAGVHVYCEKPMAPTLAECQAMVAAEAASTAHLQIGFEYMHGTMTSRLKQLLDQGFFGAPLSISVVDSRGHWWSIPPDGDGASIWKLDRKRGGGIAFHCGIHQLDMIRSYLGPLEEVTAWRAPRNALAFYPADVPDHVTFMMRAASGAVANFQIFHNRAPTFYREVPPFHPDWRTVPGHEFSLSLVGEKASCQMSIYGEELHLFRFDLEAKDTVFERTEVFRPNPADKSHHDMLGLVLRFLRGVRDGAGPIVPASEHLETMRLAFAAEDAIVTGRTIRLAEYG